MKNEELNKCIAAVKKKDFDKRKAGNIENALKLLDNKLVPYEVKNNGIHLVVDGRIDYWPTTGKFIDRHTKHADRGVFNLLKFIGV